MAGLSKVSPAKSRGKASERTRAKVRKARRNPAKGATRKAVESKQRRRPALWLNGLLVMLGAAVVLTALAQAYIKVQSIPVQQIAVTGELQHTEIEALQGMVQPALAGGFLNADLQWVRQQIEALPWIYQARVRRRWPNALEIHVLEQLPIARWGDSGFINHEGEIFRPQDTSGWQDLPLLSGPESAAKTLMADYQRVTGILAPLGLAVERLLVDERGQLEAVLVGGARLLVGGEEFRARMQRFVTVYRRQLAPRMEEVERVDLRYESGVAVAFVAGSGEEWPEGAESAKSKKEV